MGEEGLLDESDGKVLLDLAIEAIRLKLRGERLNIDTNSVDPRLRRPGASFVTLHRHGGLRGCIGRLEATRPLVEDVIANAGAAAFEDPRFPPLRTEEFDESLEVDVSVLTPAEPVEFGDRADLLGKLQPGRDGLIIEDQGRRATFLPSVWEQLPNPDGFLSHLLAKAGLSPGHWSPTLRAWRYGSQQFGPASVRG